MLTHFCLFIRPQLQLVHFDNIILVNLVMLLLLTGGSLSSAKSINDNDNVFTQKMVCLARLMLSVLLLCKSLGSKQTASDALLLNIQWLL